MAVATFFDNTLAAKMGPERLVERTAEGILLYGGLAGIDSFLTANGHVSDMLATPDGMALVERGLIVPLRRDTAGSLLAAFDRALEAGTHAQTADKRPFIALLDQAAAKRSVTWELSRVRGAYCQATDLLLTAEMLVKIGVSPEGAELMQSEFDRGRAAYLNATDPKVKQGLDVYTSTWLFNRTNDQGNNWLVGLSAADAAILWAVGRAMYSANVPMVVQLPMAVDDDFAGIEGLRVLRQHLRQMADLRVGSGLVAPHGSFVARVNDPGAAWLVHPSTLRRLKAHHLEAATGVSQAAEYQAAQLAFMADMNPVTWLRFENAFSRYMVKASGEVIEMFIREGQFRDPANISLDLFGDHFGVRMQAEGAGVMMSGLPANFDRDPVQLLARHFEVPIIGADEPGTRGSTRTAGARSGGVIGSGSSGTGSKAKVYSLPSRVSSPVSWPFRHAA